LQNQSRGKPKLNNELKFKERDSRQIEFFSSWLFSKNKIWPLASSCCPLLSEAACGLCAPCAPCAHTYKPTCNVKYVSYTGTLITFEKTMLKIAQKSRKVLYDMLALLTKNNRVAIFMPPAALRGYSLRFGGG